MKARHMCPNPIFGRLCAMPNPPVARIGLERARMSTMARPGPARLAAALRRALWQIISGQMSILRNRTWMSTR